MKRNNKKGFTIVELVIVIAVIAILAAVLIPTFAGIVAKANKSAVEQETRAALTVILAEENGQMDSTAEYFFYYNDDGDISYFKYNHTEGKLEEADATATNVVDNKLDLDVNDVIWYANDNAAILENDDVKFDEDNDAIRAPLSDIENVIVVKVVAGTTNAGLVAAEDALKADKEALGTVRAINAGDAIKYAKTEDAAIVEGKTYYTFSNNTYSVVNTPDDDIINTYYEATDVAEGSFSNVSEDGTDYTYTYIADGYTYEYSSTTAKWTITKN